MSDKELAMLEAENNELKEKLQVYEKGYWARAAFILEKRIRVQSEALRKIADCRDCSYCKVKLRPAGCREKKCVTYLAMKALSYKGDD